MSRVAILVAAAGLWALPAPAQDPRLQRLDAATQAAVVAIIDSARAAGLPAEPLVDRALEGATKRASGELIVSAVRRLAAHLRRAREVLGPAAVPPELEAGAAALRAGADPAVLAELRRRRPERPLTVPLSVLADLVGSGVPGDTATTVVLALAGLRDDDLIEFRRNVEHDVALGVLPATAASIRLADVQPGAAGPDLPRSPTARRP